MGCLAHALGTRTPANRLLRRVAAILQVQLLVEAAPEGLLGPTPLAYVRPLYQACFSGHTAIVRHLLAAAPQAAGMPLSADDPTTPLAAAVQHGHPDIVRIILEAAPQAAWVRSSNGFLPIHMAVSLDDLPCSAAIVRLLLSVTPAIATAIGLGRCRAPHSPPLGSDFRQPSCGAGAGAGCPTDNAHPIQRAHTIRCSIVCGNTRSNAGSSWGAASQWGAIHNYS